MFRYSTQRKFYGTQHGLNTIADALLITADEALGGGGGVMIA